MRLFYAGEPLPEQINLSVFLAGPTPRAAPGPPVRSWRGDALLSLAELGFEGEVFVPEPRDGRWPEDYAAQVQWEDTALRRCDRILVWLPRDMQTLPGLTTNDEWGFWKGRDPARLVLGIPDGAAHVRYQRHYANRLGVPVHPTLHETCRAAAEGEGQPRRDGECQVPLHIWRTQAFQNWYEAQRQAGNELRAASVEWVFRIRNQFVLYWALHVDVYVKAEDRRKANEVVIGRPDVAAVVLYRLGRDLLDTEVVLVREFRSSGRTVDGFIWELPGGSSVKTGEDPLGAAVSEVAQEVGLRLDPSAVRRHQARQVAATVATHQAHVFSADLTEAEMAGLRADEAAGTCHGEAAETECTYVRVRTLRQILVAKNVDWATLGIILTVLQQRLGAPLDSPSP
jgi:8-oxo-dGTP pyrophosphatase MutT (NUDIX family)